MFGALGFILSYMTIIGIGFSENMKKGLPSKWPETREDINRYIGIKRNANITRIDPMMQYDLIKTYIIDKVSLTKYGWLVTKEIDGKQVRCWDLTYVLDENGRPTNKETTFKQRWRRMHNYRIERYAGTHTEWVKDWTKFFEIPFTITANIYNIPIWVYHDNQFPKDMRPEVLIYKYGSEDDIRRYENSKNKDTYFYNKEEE